jgi:hypothetical protein
LLISEIFSERLQNFIRHHENEDPNTIVLKNRTIDGVPASFIAAQINGRRKAKEKIPDYAKNPFVIFPPKVNLEQSSSQTTAEFKVDFIKKNILDLKSCADLTGGFGVDSFFLSKTFHEVDYVEPHQSIFEVAQHNHVQLKAENIHHHLNGAENFLVTTDKKFDLIFIDPSRRKSGNQKVNSLRQSEPDVIYLQDLILTKTRFCLTKASPLFDIQLALSELKRVKIVIVVSVKNECRELLFFQDVEFEGEPVIQSVNILPDKVEYFEFKFSAEKQERVSFGPPGVYFYEPNASILKGGAFKMISKKYNIAKIHPNTHLYSSDLLVSDFPGRIFKIEEIVKADATVIARLFPNGKVNVLTRNYPLSTDELKKKLHVTDGDWKYVIGFTGVDKKYLVVAERIS